VSEGDDPARAEPTRPTGPLEPGPRPSGAGTPEELLPRLVAEVGAEVIGSDWVVRLLYSALVTDGHVLLEGMPGIAKTLLVRRFAATLALGFKRIQFTPDMLPSDIIGAVVLNPETRAFEFRRGPVFANVILADEINRAPPKVQSALLEAMQERQVTADGVARPLPRPFIVIATQNPLEQEGTYPLPEAELDRFLFRLLLDYPTEEGEQAVIRRHLTMARDAEPAPTADARQLAEHRQRVDDVFVSDDVVAYVARLVRATRDDARILVGASPRASVQLARAAKVQAMLDGRAYVVPEDVKRIAFWGLNHRLTLQPDILTEGYARGLSDGEILRATLVDLLGRVPVPR
jgi:MoxR-like ATPase